MGVLKEIVKVVLYMWHVFKQKIDNIDYSKGLYVCTLFKPSKAAGSY